MKKNLFALLRALFITLGLHILLTVTVLFLSHTVHRELGQAMLFLAVTLLLVLGICLFAAIPTDKRGILWGCFGIAYGSGTVLSVVSVIFYGGELSGRWPGSGNMAWLLFLLLILTAWSLGVLAVTVFRSARIGREIRENNRRVERMRKGFRKEFPPLSKGRAGLYAAVKGFLWVVWYHTLTGLLLFALMAVGAENTMISYISFPVLWCLLSALYGGLDSPCRGVFALSATVSNLAFFVLSSYFCMLIHTEPHQYRIILHLDSVLTDPFASPEQMLAIAIFFAVWIAMIVFAVGHRKKKAT